MFGLFRKHDIREIEHRQRAIADLVEPVLDLDAHCNARRSRYQVGVKIAYAGFEHAAHVNVPDHETMLSGSVI